MAQMGRLLTAMVPPFTPEGELDLAQAQRLAMALLNSGSDGVVVSGTTGEAPTLTTEEKLRLFAEVKRAVGDAGAVVAGTGNYNTAERAELSREAARVGVDGLLLTTPYYNKPTQEGIFRHFEAIAKATSLPCILYNIPGRTGVNVTAETTIRLSHIPTIAGVKEASGQPGAPAPDELADAAGQHPDPDQVRPQPGGLLGGRRAPSPLRAGRCHGREDRGRGAASSPRPAGGG